MSKLENLADKKPEIQKVLDVLVELSTEHDGCCWEMGDIYNRIQEKFRRAGPAGLTDKDLETETASLKTQSAKDSSICYRIGTKYNELCQLLGQDEAEVLKEDHPRLIFSELAPFGKVAERFTEEHSVAYGMEKMVHLIEYAELNRLTLDGDPGQTEVSLLQEDGRWKRIKFRACSADELAHTVIALKAQKGLPVDNDFYDL